MTYKNGTISGQNVFCIETEKEMNNKRGGVGAKILLVLFLMLLAAGGGAYGFSVFDGKMAVRDAQKIIKDVEIGDYDTEEATQIQGYIDSIEKDLATAKSRKEVYEIMEEFRDDVSKVKTKTQKELEAARKEAEEARQANQNNQNNNNSNSNTDGSNGTDNTSGFNTENSQNGDSGSGYKSNNLSGSQEEEESNGILNNFFGS